MEDEQAEGIMTSHAIQNIIMSWSCGIMQTQAIKVLSLKSRYEKHNLDITTELCTISYSQMLRIPLPFFFSPPNITI